LWLTASLFAVATRVAFTGALIPGFVAIGRAFVWDFSFWFMVCSFLMLLYLYRRDFRRNIMMKR